MSFSGGLSRQARTLLRIHRRVTATEGFKSSLERFYVQNPHRRGRKSFLMSSVAADGTSDSRAPPPPRAPSSGRQLYVQPGLRFNETVAYDPCSEAYTTGEWIYLAVGFFCCYC